MWTREKIQLNFNCYEYCDSVFVVVAEKNHCQYICISCRIIRSCDMTADEQNPHILFTAIKRMTDFFFATTAVILRCSRSKVCRRSAEMWQTNWFYYDKLVLLRQIEMLSNFNGILIDISCRLLGFTFKSGRNFEGNVLIIKYANSIELILFSYEYRRQKHRFSSDFYQFPQNFFLIRTFRTPNTRHNDNTCWN